MSVFFRDRTNPLTELDDIDFHSRFRMNKRCFCNLLDRIELELRHATQLHSGLLPIQHLDSALQFYALASFLLCDAMHKSDYCQHVVSVRLSVTFMFCAKTNKDIFEIFSPSGSQAILVFHTKQGGAISTGNPLTGASNATGVWKNDDFQPISRSIWKMVIVRWAHAARQFISIEFSFHPYNI